MTTLAKLYREIIRRNPRVTPFRYSWHARYHPFSGKQVWIKDQTLKERNLHILRQYRKSITFRGMPAESITVGEYVDKCIRQQGYKP